MHWMTTKWPWTIIRPQVQGRSYASTPESQISIFFALQRAVRVTGHFETYASNDQETTLNNTRSKSPDSSTSTNEYRISFRFALRPSVFELTGYYSIYHKCTEWRPNDLKQYMRSKVLHIGSICISESQISTRFTPRPAVCKSLAILRRALNDPNFILNTRM